ncbi:MAG: ribosome-binding factor A, partial [Spirochaetales bacterium]|nr:ribosome-binding factor A [Spirochaetales bacterium]
MGQFRLQRLGEQLREEIATMILRHEIKDPRVNEFL